MEKHLRLTLCVVSLVLWIFSRIFTHILDTNMLVSKTREFLFCFLYYTTRWVKRKLVVFGSRVLEPLRLPRRKPNVWCNMGINFNHHSLFKKPVLRFLTFIYIYSIPCLRKACVLSPRGGWLGLHVGDVAVYRYEHGDVGDRGGHADCLPVVLVVETEVGLPLVALPVGHQVERGALNARLHSHLNTKFVF